MKILGIESASLTASAALVDEETVIAEYTVNYKKTHSQTLLPMIQEITRMTELDLSTLDAIAVSGGPGSFTGLRIGSATGKGLGLALDKPLIHVPTLDAMAYNLYGSARLVCPMLDAKRGQVFTGVYRVTDAFEPVLPGCAIDCGELLEKINAVGEPVVFLGDGVPVSRRKIEELCRVPYTFAPSHQSRQRAAAVAALGLIYLKEGKTETAAEHVPEYFRISQAERERNARLARENAGADQA